MPPKLSDEYKLRMLTEQLAGGMKQLSHEDPKVACKKLDLLLKYLTSMRSTDAMSRRTYTIDLKIDFEDNTRHEIATKMMRKAARNILTQSNLIADGRPPQVALRSEDFFEGTDELGVVDPTLDEDAG
jgi:hypothetical protein